MTTRIAKKLLFFLQLKHFHLNWCSNFGKFTLLVYKNFPNIFTTFLLLYNETKGELIIWCANHKKS